MAGPWEQFKEMAPAGVEGPWSRFAAPQASSPQGFVPNALDFVKSIPRGMVTGFTGLPNPNMALTGDEVRDELQRRAVGAETVKEGLPAPQGRAGRVGEAVGEAVGNPLSYVGPGGVALKVGGAALSGAASEGAGQAAEGTAFERPARILAALAGGAVAGKTLGPSAPKAEIPTSDELFTAGRAGYKQARDSGLEVKPDAVSSWASRVEQELIGPDHGFTGGAEGVAPKTFGVLSTLQNAPAGTVAVTAANVDALRKNLGRIASETQPAAGGFAKPTPDAAAASITLKRLGDFTENLPQGSVMAGNATDYVRATKQANGNWGAGERVRDFDARLTKAENATDRQVAGSLDSQIKIKAGQLLDNPTKTRGLSDAEREQLQLVNSGDWKSNALRQFGRGGAGVIPLGAQLAAAGPVFAAGGPAATVIQALIAAGLYGARKGSEAITKSRANTLAEMLAKRSPEYEQRLSNLPPADQSPATAAIIRALMSQQ